jgi:hypothetical protein
MPREHVIELGTQFARHRTAHYPAVFASSLISSQRIAKVGIMGQKSSMETENGLSCADVPSQAAAYDLQGTRQGQIERSL